MYFLPEGSSMQGLPDFYGCICQPRNRQVPLGVKEGRPWCFDNDCFNGPFNPSRWVTTFQKFVPYKKTCAFVVCPDVVANATATKSLWYSWLDFFTAWGVPLAFVLQNGQKSFTIPEHASWVFVGGDNEFKLGEEGETCVREARGRGMRVHMGRVNSFTRLRYAKAIGCDSVDGTYICYGKDINTPKLTAMMEKVNDDRQIPLFG